MRAIAEEKKMRFSDLKEALPEINSRMLSERLSELEEEGLIVRNVQQTKPIVIEYEVTEKGMDLKKVFSELCSWCKKWGCDDEKHQ